MTRHAPSAPVPPVAVERRWEASVFTTRPDLKAEAVRFIESARAGNTRRARRADWKVFEDWCAANSVDALPASPETVGAFLADMARTRATSTIARYGGSIAAEHARRGFEPPTLDSGVLELMAGLRREKGIRAEGKAPITDDLLEQMIARCPATLHGLRDRALLLFGFTTAMRREEICGTTIADLQWIEQGVIVNLRRSKTDQEGEGQQKAVPYETDNPALRPAAVLREWLDASGIDEGPIFRGILRNDKAKNSALNGREVARIVKRAIRSIGLDPAKFGGHSLRAGYVTTARIKGLDWGVIMEQTGHRQLATVKGYSRFTPEVFNATRVVDVFKKGSGK